ncbi:MAG: hypothetical protein PWQ55_2369 [Chloroflexota bacterium]|nr:hypothetical protein [Chloroflexota bacterium]
MWKAFWRIILPILVLTACSGAPETPPNTQDSTGNADTPDQPAAAAATPGTEAVVTAPAEPFRPLTREVTFTASDGTELQGTFYPPENDDAPLIILMHWARGDRTDYDAIADWLQNRGGEPDIRNTADLPYLDASWFPPVEAGSSYGVLTFTFQDCDQGCAGFHPAEWLDDAQSAVDFACDLPYIDPKRILIAGASIGADGAADACQYLNQQAPGTCKGAFSISPGGYLTETYADAVAQMGAPAVCVYAQSDDSAVAACADVQADQYTAYELGDAHGMDLVDPQVQPNPLDLLYVFITDNI